MPSSWKIGHHIKDPNTGKNRWQIKNILQGGMGIVYLCYDHLFQEFVALKTFKDRLLKKETARQRFIREADTWVQLEKHPNIVTAKYVRTIENKPYIFLEYIAGSPIGVDLAAWIAKGCADLKTSLEFAIQFCDGMIHASERFREIGKTFIHRDIKPGNILITADHTAKVTDFGLTKVFLPDASDSNYDRYSSKKNVVLTEIGTIVGTPPYMSPEQCAGEIELDAASDIYSFGCVLYEMLGGQPVFECTSLKEYCYFHCNKQPIQLKEINQKIPEPVNQLIMRCLKKAPADRPQNFAELRDSLHDIYLNFTRKRIVAPTGIKLQAWEWVSKSLALADIGKYQEALAACDNALKIDPMNASAFSNKGYIYNILGGHNKALESCNKAISIDSTFAPAWNNRGNSLAGLGIHGEAIHSFDQAIALDSFHINAWLNKGNSLFTLGRLHEAICCYEKVLSLNSNDADAWHNLGYTWATIGYHEKAVACFDNAIVINPEYGESWSLKGASLIELGRKEEAQFCFKQALALDPENQTAILGKIFCQQRDSCQLTKI